MKSHLISIPELAELWGKSSDSLRQKLRRGTFGDIFHLDKYQAEKIGLCWGNARGCGSKRGRPFISINDPAIPEFVRKKYHRNHMPELHSSESLYGGREPAGTEEETALPQDEETLPEPAHNFELALYQTLSSYQRRQIDKYLSLIRETEGMSRKEIEKAISEWNEKNPGLKTTYNSFRTARKEYRRKGIEALVSGHGNRAGSTKIKKEWMEYFKSLYLKEGAPSGFTCWLMTFGKFSGNKKTFPHCQTFLYQLNRRIPEDAIYLARHGERAWNRKYGMYIERDYSHIKSGECFVSDHAQIDVAVFDPNDKPHFPWVTAWRDLKSGKWVSWLVHIEPPNSDHIFQSFYYALKDFGVPKHIYMDNGKDYRSKDFAGGRRAGKVTVEEKKTRTVCGLLGITPHFSLPYNPQSKTIERDFLKIKEQFSKHLAGYRGGNIKERPEILRKQIKQGAILNFNDFCNLLDMYIAHNLNKMPSDSRVLRGMCPDELYKLEAENSFIKPEQLSILCQRSSSDLTIGRNGVKDGKHGITYFAEWMFGVKGKKVYLRRDPTRMQQAFVFDSKTDEYLGSAWINEAVPAISEDDVSRGMLKEKMRTKKLARKISKVYAKPQVEVNAFEKIVCMSNGVSMLNRKRGYTPDSRQKEVKVLESGFAKKVLEKEEKQASLGRGDSSRILPSGKKIYQYVSDKSRDEETDKEITMREKKKLRRP